MPHPTRPVPSARPRNDPIPPPSPFGQAALVVMACLAVYWAGLSHAGLSASEGFRVIPAFEALERNDWLVITLFGQLYLRKPPGMVWAVAVASMLVGETEFAGRSVSALASTLNALPCLWFARRRFAACALSSLASSSIPVAIRFRELLSLRHLRVWACVLLWLGVAHALWSTARREQQAAGRSASTWARCSRTGPKSGVTS